MQRTDLPLDEIERRADLYFERKGTGRGSGYKQYQRWLYEKKFHVDENNRIIPPIIEAKTFAEFQRNNKDTSRDQNDPWIEMGPDNWNNTSGWNPGVGRVTSIVANPANEGVIYVSSPGGGIWKSIDNGNTWVSLLDDANAAWMYIYHIHLDPSNYNTLYASVMNGGGVIKTTNGGATWFATGAGPIETRKVIVHPTNNNIVLATAFNGIWRSTDGGSTWINTNVNDAEDIEFKPGDPNTVYASGTSNVIRRSTNNGVSWSVIGAAEGITHFGRTLLAVSPQNPAVVYAVQSDPSLIRFGRLYKSTNSGASFSTTIVGNPAAGTNFFGYDVNGMDTIGQAYYDMAICVNPTNANEVHIGGISCWKSIDGGLSFIPETVWSYPNNVGYNHADIHALEYVNSATIYSGSDGGIYRSLNQGGDWEDLSGGLGIRQIYRISNAATDANRIVIGNQDNGTSFRQSNGSWWDWLGADGMDNMISPTNANIAYGMWQFGGLNKTTDGGLTRTFIPQPSDGNWITPVAMHPTNHNIIYVGWTGIYQSTNGGNDWILISGNEINSPLNTLAVASSNTNYIYGSVDNILYRTSNGGIDWSSVSLPSDISSIFISKTDPEKIWITLYATSNQVQFSSNMGTTFTPISAGLPALSARSVVVDETDTEGNGVYVGLNIGVYYRTDNSPSWELFGTELPLVAINELEIHAVTSKLRVATYGRGVWENTLSSTTGGNTGCVEIAYVPAIGSDNVSVVDLSTNNLITTIPVGLDPWGVCHSSTGEYVFVTNRGSHNVSVIDPVTNNVQTTIPLTNGTSPEGIAILPDNSKIYTANKGNSTVTEIDALTHTVISYLDVFEQPIFVESMPDGSHIYVTYSTMPFVRTINTATHVAFNIALPTKGGDIKFTPDGTKAFISNRTNSIYVINTTTNNIDHTINFPGSFYAPNAMWITPDGEKLYVALLNQQSIAVINTASYSIEHYISGFSGYLEALSASQDGNTLYVTNSTTNKVYIINTFDNQVIGNFDVGNLPTGFGDFVLNCTIEEDTLVCNTNVYDSGGAFEDYANNEDYITVLCPESPLDYITLTFNDFALENGWDYLAIYDGNSINDPALHPGAGFTGSQSPGVLHSSHLSGCLTLHFTSDASNTDIGWDAEVTCSPQICGSEFVDSGGSQNQYSNNENVVTTLCPAQPGAIIELTFIEFELEQGWDYLKLFDGPSLNDPALHPGNGYTGLNSPGIVSSSHSSGCITAHFTSDFSETRDGWIATINCIPPSTCNEAFYDSGGANADYSDAEDIVTTFCPPAATSAIELSFTQFVTEDEYDALYIFDGPSINSPIIHSGNDPTLSGFPSGGYYGTISPPTISSSHESGCITARFLSDGSIVYAGWTAEVDCYDRPINDDCSEALQLNCGSSVYGSNLYANYDNTAICQFYLAGQHGVWYTFIGTGDSVLLSTCSPVTNFDSQIHVFAGDCSNLECIAANDDSNAGCGPNFLASTIKFFSIPGQTYFILVSGYQRDAGNFNLSATCTAPCSTHVTQINDNGPGSLRNAVNCLTGSDTITFDASINNQIIDLTSGAITMPRNIHLLPAVNQTIKIRTLGNHRLFNVPQDYFVKMENVQLFGGQITTGSAIHNQGQLNLKNVTLSPYPNQPGSILYNTNNGIITIENTTELRHQ